MAFIKIKSGWEIPECDVTPESVYSNRRQFLKRMGGLGLGAYALVNGCTGNQAHGQDASVWRSIPKAEGIYPVQRNTKYMVDREIAREEIPASYNNFYEFTTDKDRVWKLAEKFKTKPWQVEVSGLVNKGGTFDVEDLLKTMPFEERVYRHRNVEAWSMVVPWTGFPLTALIDKVEPTSKAKFIRFVTFNKPDQAIGQKTQSWYPWPYYEALTMEEATNELTMLVTGIYGHAMPTQHGAPIRLVTPWKYGYKSIKSIVKIEFVRKQPATFWTTVAPSEYGFTSNVNPKIPHPRWAQATERDINTGERIPTRPYNGYEDYVGHLYKA